MDNSKSATHSYTQEDLKRTYGNVNEHLHIHRIIVKFSKTKDDIRKVALDNLKLENVHNVLDLGCGFGFFSMALNNKISAEHSILGLDALIDNKESYLANTRKMNLNADFLCDTAHRIQKFPAKSYDLVSASYSLYFFVDLIPEITRILKPNGYFIAITHSRKNLEEITSLLPDCYRESGIKFGDKLHIQNLLNSFCTENAESLLAPYFAYIDEIRWNNYLEFSQGSMEDLQNYVYNKRTLLIKEVLDEKPELENQVLSILFERMNEILLAQGKFRLNKDDAIFRCSFPTMD